MPNSYTDKLNKQLPAAGDNDWEDEYYINERIDDVVMGALLSKNRVISGGVVTHNADLDVDYTALVVEVAGEIFRISGSAKTMVPASTTPEQVNWIYVDDTGTIINSVDRPTGDYVPLALVDTNDVMVLRIADLRPFADAVEGEVEDLIINPRLTINQRVFDGNWSALAVGDFGWDRWRKSATADKMIQPICEGNYIPSSSYYLFGNVVTAAKLTAPSSGTWEIEVPDTATEIHLIEGEKIRPVRRRTAAEDLDLCELYFEKTYDLGTAPGAITSTGQVFEVTARATNTGQALVGFKYKRKIKIPAVTIYSPLTGAPNKMKYLTADAVVAITNIGEARCTMQNNNGGSFADSSYYSFHATIEGEF